MNGRQRVTAGVGMVEQARREEGSEWMPSSGSRRAGSDGRGTGINGVERQQAWRTCSVRLGARERFGGDSQRGPGAQSPS